MGFPVTSIPTDFRLFPSVVLGMCWGQIEQVSVKSPRGHLRASVLSEERGTRRS